MTTYRDAGVDIDEGDRLVEMIKPLAKATLRPEVLAGVGGFGGLFQLPVDRYQEPVLVAGTDGVGTKLKLAFLTGRHDTIGIDLVAMSVNDIAVTGAEPLFFLDYFATSRLKAEEAREVIRGIAEGCRQAGCALLGGETAELPGFYTAGEYDLAGFAVGVAEKSKLVDGKRARAGDVVLGLASTGLHSNGYSLARKVLLEKMALNLDEAPAELGRPLGEVLLTPTRIYTRDVLALLEQVEVKAMAHITGGGLPGNLPRTLPDALKVVVRTSSWPRPPIFELIARGGVAEDEMFRTFNMGIGLTAVVDAADADRALKLIEDRGLQAWRIGELAAASGEATVELV